MASSTFTMSRSMTVVVWGSTIVPFRFVFRQNKSYLMVAASRTVEFPLSSLSSAGCQADQSYACQAALT